MSKFLKISALFLFLLFLYSCGSVGEALQGKKRADQGDEFLIDKKNPLSMPPDYDKLPEPGEASLKSTKDIETDQLNLEDLLKNKKDCLIKNNCEEKILDTDESTSIENSILKKIK